MPVYHLINNKMETGKKDRVMIACVTFETVKVIEPIKFYESNKVHLIHYISDSMPSDNTKVYKEFYEEVTNQIKKINNNIIIEEHKDVSVSDFSGMLRTVLEIIEKEKENDIMVNISAGSSEYAAASAIAAMMMGIRPFSVNSGKYKINGYENIKKFYYEGDKPIGLTAEIKTPSLLPKYFIKMPDENLVRGLAIYAKKLEKGERVKSKEMCKEFKEIGIWYRDKENTDTTNAVYYHRDFFSKWKSHNWIVEDPSRKSYKLTDEGENVVNTFYLNEDNKQNGE